MYDGFCFDVSLVINIVGICLVFGLVLSLGKNVCCKCLEMKKGSQNMLNLNEEEQREWTLV